MPNINSFLIIIFGISSLLFLAAFLREFLLRKNLQKQADLILKESRQKAQEIIDDAVKKGHELIVSAQTQTEHIEKEYDGKIEETTTKARQSIEKSASQFQEYLHNLKEEISNAKPTKVSELALQQTAKQVEQALTNTQTGFEQYLKDLRSDATGTQAEAEEAVKQRVNQMFEKFEQDLSEFLTNTQQQSGKAIEAEIKSARSLIETYKTQQLALIDENVVAMLEKTLALVLNKKLSLKDQTELVYQSLEKAKADKFIA